VKRALTIALVLLFSGCGTAYLSNCPKVDCSTEDMLYEMQREKLRRCQQERETVRIVATCPHQWEALGPGRKGCQICGSIADNICGTWKVVLAGGKWIGPPPCKDYPKCCDQ
jgi:hypothetical protein